MYPHQSLLLTLTPLLLRDRSGLLVVSGEFGFNADIYLWAGCIIHCEHNLLTGANAARSIAKRAITSTRFYPGVSPELLSPMNINTHDFISMLRKAEQTWETVRGVIPNWDAVYALKKKNWTTSNVTPIQMRVLNALNGKRTVRQVIHATGLPDLDVFRTIYWYLRRRLVRLVPEEKPMEHDLRDQLLNYMKQTLADIVGPAAEKVIDNAFDAIETRPERLSDRQLSSLVSAICSKLDLKERRNFNSWAGGMGRRQLYDSTG